MIEAGGDRSGEARVPPFEWAVALLGVLFVGGSVAFMIWQALQEPPPPPDITVEEETISAVQSGYLVQYVARNRGGETASSLRLDGELRERGEVVERSEAILDFLPGMSQRRGGLFFQRDPRVHELQLRASGYESP